MKAHGFRKILLATDGSHEADVAVDAAASFAHAGSASVRAVHVWNLEVHHRHGVWDVEMRTEADSLIERTMDRLQQAGIDATGTILRADSGHVAAAIAEAAREFEADLVVVGSRGLSDWQSLVRHSVSHQLLGAVDCPVLVVRGKVPERVHDAERVLLAVAGGDDLRPAVAAAMAAAAAPGSEVLVVHVAQAVLGSQGFAYVESDEEIEQTMAQATAAFKAAGITTHELVLESGPVADVVAETAHQWQADVIVIGSSRMGDVGSLVFGSVTHGLLRAADRPVLVAERIRS